MNIIDHPSPNHSERKAGVRVDTVLLHHTGTKHPDGLVGALAVDLAWLRNPEAGVSAHYVVGPSGGIYRLVPEERKAWHAGKGRLPWETCEPYDFNHRSIGIEVVNPGDGVTPFTEAQYRALEWLVPDVARRLGWDCATFLYGHTVDLLPGVRGQRGYVLGHRDVAPGRKTDPAGNFDWGRISKALAGGGV